MTYNNNMDEIIYDNITRLYICISHAFPWINAYGNKLISGERYRVLLNDMDVFVAKLHGCIYTCVVVTDSLNTSEAKTNFQIRIARVQNKVKYEAIYINKLTRYVTKGKTGSICLLQSQLRRSMKYSDQHHERWRQPLLSPVGILLIRLIWYNGLATSLHSTIK